MEFRLSSHEVMRGIKVANGALVLRPLGLVTAASVIDALVGGGMLALAWLVGGWWWVLVPYGVFLMIDGALRLRISVRASENDLTVRNRWRSLSWPISDVAAARVEAVEWVFRSPAYVFTRWAGPQQWQVGIVAMKDGERVMCDALISHPPRQGDDPTPTEMKIATLNRWIETVPSAT